MESNPIIFAGVNIVSGRKPVTFAALDGELHILELHRWTPEESISCLNNHENILLAVNTASKNVTEFKDALAPLGYKPRSKQGSRRWIDTDAQLDFVALCENELLSLRTVEGRIQRALILYEEGLQIPDPMDFYEEITRHKLMQGLLPLENVYTMYELDALIVAYISWMFVNDPLQVRMRGNQVLLSKEAG
jgi:hypothetical protein